MTQLPFETMAVNEQDVLDALKKTPQRIGPLATQFDVSVTILVTVLNRMCNDGLLTTDSWGYYRIRQELPK